MGGPPVDNVAIDVEGERMLLKLMGLSAIVGLSLAWWYLRDVRLTAMVFIGGVYSAAISLAMVYALGGQINSVLLTMPSVVYTAGLSAAIHIINYYRHIRVQEGLARGAPSAACKAAWIPCMLSAGTTSLGLDLAVHQRPGADSQFRFLHGRGRDDHAGLHVPVPALGVAALAPRAAPRSARQRA